MGVRFKKNDQKVDLKIDSLKQSFEKKLEGDEQYKCSSPKKISLQYYGFLVIAQERTDEITICPNYQIIQEDMIELKSCPGMKNKFEHVL